MPKQLIRTFELTDVQAEAILNMRLRSLRKLEEIEIRKEHDKLTDEKDQLTKLLGSDARQWTKISKEIGEIAKVYGPETDIGKRRTDKAEAPEADLVDIQQAMIEKEPITVIISEKGWIRALKGHQADLSSLSFKQGDKLKLSFHAETTGQDPAVLLRRQVLYHSAPDRLPGGRGHGEPIRFMVEMDEAQDVVNALSSTNRDGNLLLSSNNEARGFVVCEDDVIANTRKGKQVLQPDRTGGSLRSVSRRWVTRLRSSARTASCWFSRSTQIAQMGRGRGVRLQRYRDGNHLRHPRLQERRRTDLDRTVPAAASPAPWKNSPTGAANAVMQDACHLPASRAPTSSGRRRFKPSWRHSTAAIFQVTCQTHV
jgi:topoisomerase-4 subunit A